MTATTIPAPSPWTRRYPPLAFLALAVLIAAFILPSSLNLPQSNPSTVLEYAPIPPKDDSPNPPNGNLGSLGLGSSGTLSAGGEPPPPPPPPIVERGTGSKPVTKHCVQDPKTGKVRQADDPMAPPCVPFFAPDGNNFGNTYQGVTKDEITVLIYLDVAAYNNEDTPANGTYVDLNIVRPSCPQTYPSNNPNAQNCDSVPSRGARALALYFGDHYQTYNRTVHMWAYYTNVMDDAGRKKDAQDNWSKLHPFAVLDEAVFNGHNNAYITSMAGRGVLVFSAFDSQPNDFYKQSAPLAWSFWPDVEHAAAGYAGFVCTKVKGTKVQHSGNGPVTFNGADRIYGIFHADDPGHPELTLMYREVLKRLNACGIQIAVTETFPKAGYSVDSTDPGTAQTTAVQGFQSAHVNTILWPGGIESKFSSTAAGQSYYPEIVILGDLSLDGIFHGQLMNQDVWQNVYGTVFAMRIDRSEDTPGYKADREAAPNDPADDGIYAADFYRAFFELFQGIQVAGPKLTPDEISKGYHAIPSFSSTNPYVAAFFFDPGDYTGVKDAAEVWWDRNGMSPASTAPGCMRMVNQGVRFLPDKWQPGFDAFGLDNANPPDPCTASGPTTQLRPT